MSRYFNYTNAYWQDRMKSEDKLTVLGEFMGAVIDGFGQSVKGGDWHAPKHCLTTIDKEARKLARSSDGVQDDFKLSEDWVRSVLWQVIVDGAEVDGHSESIPAAKNIFGRVGWDYTKYENVTHTELTTLLEVKYLVGSGVESHCNVELVSMHSIPLCSVWRAKSGAEWEIVEHKGDSLNCTNSNGSYKNFSTIQVRNMERVV